MKDIRIMRELLSEFRKAAPKADFIVQRSNHTDRLEKYIAKRAPALTSLPGLKYEALIGFETLGITYAKKLSEIAPSVLMGHGDEGNLSGVSGMTGLKLAQVTQKSVVIGHTHRLGLVYESVGHSGQVSSKFAMEVGNLMDLSQAHYLRPRGAANWQQGFGVLWVSGKRVQPQVVKMTRDGSFIFDGKEF